MQERGWGSMCLQEGWQVAATLDQGWLREPDSWTGPRPGFCELVSQAGFY